MRRVGQACARGENSPVLNVGALLALGGISLLTQKIEKYKENREGSKRAAMDIRKLRNAMKTVRLKGKVKIRARM